METDAAALGRTETVCTATGGLKGGHEQMQPHACERQDGQTTLGPQSFQQGPRNWHCQSLKPDSGGIGEGEYHIPNTTYPCLCSPSPCLETHTQRRDEKRELSKMSWTLLRWHLPPSVFAASALLVLLSLLHLRTQKPTAGQMLERPKTSKDTPSSCVTHQDHPSWPWWTLETLRPYGLEIDSSQVSGGCSTMAWFTDRHQDSLAFSTLMGHSR